MKLSKQQIISEIENLVDENLDMVVHFDVQDNMSLHVGIDIPKLKALVDGRFRDFYSQKISVVTRSGALLAIADIKIDD